MTHRGPFQPLLFCDSVIPHYFQGSVYTRFCLYRSNTSFTPVRPVNLSCTECNVHEHWLYGRNSHPPQMQHMWTNPPRDCPQLAPCTIPLGRWEQAAAGMSCLRRLGRACTYETGTPNFPHPAL